MLSSISDKYASKRFILASSSPRRREICEKLGLEFRILAPSVDENIKLSDYQSVGDFVEALARLKADDVFSVLSQSTHCDCLISADTVIYFEGNVIGKPHSRSEAIAILQRLSGRVHHVYTGVCIYWIKCGEVLATDLFHSCTSVTMATLDLDVIEAYVNSGEPMDKAGAYAIQGIGCTLIEAIEGDFYNVVGLPAHELSKRILARIRAEY